MDSLLRGGGDRDLGRDARGRRFHRRRLDHGDSGMGPGGDPAGTAYLVELSTDPAFSVFTTSATRNASAAFPGLFGNTTYYVQVQAVNFSGIPSGFSAYATTLTYAAAPTTMTYQGFTYQVRRTGP